MKNIMKKNKGITLITVSIAVIILLTITGTTIYNFKQNFGMEKVRGMQSDVSTLRDKVASYYAQYGAIPIIADKPYNFYANVVSKAVDTGKFYVIDLSSLENLTLIYGQDYEEIKKLPSGSNVNEYKDVYLINETSHNIFYAGGIKHGGKTFYTDYTEQDVDVAPVNLKVVDNISIPSNYTYIGGNKKNGIVIQNDTNAKKYTWKVVEEPISELPGGIVLGNNEKEKVIESINIYDGYYLASDGNIECLPTENLWSEKYQTSGIYKDKNGETAYIPANFYVSLVPTKDTIAEGLVARDTNYNEWVWIPVPKTMQVYKNAGLQIIAKDGKFTEEQYKLIESDLMEYTKEYRKEEYVDQWYAYSQDNKTIITETNANDTEKNLENGCGLNLENYKNYKNKMLQSIYENGGFWISRYEIGSTITVSKDDNGARIPVSQEKSYVYNYVTCQKAQELSETMTADSNMTSSLLFGMQWDLVCKFVESNSNTKDTDKNKVLNIYNLAGNVSEWTLTSSSVYRGENGENNDISSLRSYY